jgi:alpha-tubulin suppressor-like RCC1 family protein
MGQLGDGTTTKSSVPVAVSGLTGVTSISAGNATSCAVLTDGSARCWGSGWQGALGDGTKMNSLVPVAVSGLSNVASIAAGGFHTCAALTDGTARCWGSGTSGEGTLGDGADTYDAPTPLVVSGLSGVTGIAVGEQYSCAALADGTVWCWGRGEFGQLADVTTWASPVPVAIPGVTGMTEVITGWTRTCAVGPDTMLCWGGNDWGQLGNGTTVDSRTPVAVQLP